MYPKGKLSLKEMEPEKGSSGAAPMRKVHHATSEGEVMVHG